MRPRSVLQLTSGVPAALSSYFALMESAALIAHAVEEQLRTDTDLSYVQFQLLARLTDTPGQQLTMSELADGVVYSRTGLTHQAGVPEKAGLVTLPSENSDSDVMTGASGAQQRTCC